MDSALNILDYNTCPVEIQGSAERLLTLYPAGGEKVSMKVEEWLSLANRFSDGQNWRETESPTQTANTACISPSTTMVYCFRRGVMYELKLPPLPEAPK